MRQSQPKDDFNPLPALQTLLADVAPARQRARAAQQLADHLQLLPTAAALFATYEPYLPLLAELAGQDTAAKGARELRAAVLAMLAALAGHNARRFADWIALRAQLAHERWLVDWSAQLLQEAERRLPRTDAQRWNEKTVEFLEFDAAVARVLQIWRTLLDHAADEDVIQSIVSALGGLLSPEDQTLDQRRALALKKLQPHFVDVADVLIGWAIHSQPGSNLRDGIVSLLQGMTQLWADNSVFSLQLLVSFAEEITGLSTAATGGDNDAGARLSMLVVCFLMVAHSVPEHALSRMQDGLSPLERVLRAAVASCGCFEASDFFILKCAEFLSSISASTPTAFAPLALRAAKLLVCQTAMLELHHDTPFEAIAESLNTAFCIIQKNVDLISSFQDSREEVVSLLELTVSVKAKKGGPRPKTLSALVCLYRLQANQSLKGITRLFIVLLRVGGISAMKIVAACAMSKPYSAKLGEPNLSFSAFCATTFILSIKNLRRHGLDADELEQTKEAGMMIANSLETAKYQQGSSHRADIGGRMLTALLKTRADDTAYWKDPEVVNIMLQVVTAAAIQLAENSEKMSQSTLKIVLNLIREVVRRQEVQVVLSNDSRASIVSGVSLASQCLGSDSRDLCLAILSNVADGVSDPTVVGKLAVSSLDFLLDSSSAIRERALWNVLGKVASEAVTTSFVPSTGAAAGFNHTTFTAVDFQDVLGLLANPESTEEEWAAFCSTLIDQQELDSDQGVASRTKSTTQALRTVARQAAEWCVQNRLRTHFGGPAQTFASIEQLLLMYTVPKIDDKRSSHQGLSDNVSLKASSLLLSPNSWWGVGKWLTLEFVSSLELFIDHTTAASEPEHDLESEAYKTRMFFRANRAVCDDWLNRIRPLLAEMSSISSSMELSRLHYYAIVSVSYSKLRRILQAVLSSREQKVALSIDLVSAEDELDSALFSLCRCCCDLKDVDTIVGLQKWASRLSMELERYQPSSADESTNDTKAPHFGWLSAIQMEASMQYEDAIEAYKELLRPVLRLQHPESHSEREEIFAFFESPLQSIRMSITTLLGCVRQCSQCFIRLQKWPQARSFVESFVRATAFVEQRRDFPGAQSVIDCIEVWKQDLELIQVFELKEDRDSLSSSANWHFGISPHQLIASHRWGLLSDSERLDVADLLTTRIASESDFVVSRLREIALQPEFSTGRSVGKKLEQLLLDIARFSRRKNVQESSYDSTKRLGQVYLGGMSTLDPSRHDSASWAAHIHHIDDFSLDDAERLQNWKNLARLARKQRNFELASGLLKRAESLASLATMPGGISLQMNYERARLLAAMGAEADGFRALSRECGPALLALTAENSLTVRSALVQALGRLAASLNSAATLSFEDLPSILKLIQPVLDFRSNDDSLRASDVETDSSIAAAEKCLRVATTIMPKSPNAWFRYSNWCYELGKREVDQVMGHNGYIHLSPVEEVEITTILNELGVAGPSRDAIAREFCLIFENGAVVPHGEKLRRICSEHVGSLVDESAIGKLVALQATCRARVLRYHLLAANSYGVYLQVQGNNTKDARDDDGKKQRVMLVTLRVLHLLTKYGSEKDIVASVEQTFQSGPVAPWAQVVPQLIARADHPNVTVSTLVCLMLERLARSYPHLLVYPAVVDSSGVSGTVVDPEAPSTPRLKGVIDALRNVSSNLVDGVSLLVSELRRVSILWDEAWIAVLVKLSTDVSRRTATLEKESARVARNTSLSYDEKRELAERKFVAIMKPVLLSLERVWATTCGAAGRHGPLTSHEQRFLREHGALLERVLVDLRESCTIGKMTTPESFSPQRVQVIWEPLDSMLKSLLSSAGRRDRLSLNEISPALLSIADLFERINMPGIGRSPAGPSTDTTRMVHIQKLLPSVSVLKTKTKPKLLQFIGSDGNKHRYLLKAKEDLRLDERIMQFLVAVNSLLKADKAASVRDLTAKNYSVIPISNDAGLIQMVPNVLPFFQIYTSNQELNASGRNPQMSPQPAGRGVAATTAANAPQPPTVQFYAMLKQHGIVDASQRSKWPMPVLRQIYADLVRQLPRNMLKQELSLRSQDLRESWTKGQRLIKSLAVMSVLGYVVGLGDRHLDNILLCVNSGDVVHIDYNVCFDKGRRLKVPEVVPFRLTPMLQDALGLTGTEGPFRIAFETTLRVVRAENSREALLTLLEAFVYSPLTEWITEDSRRTGKVVDLKTRLEVNVNLSLFLSRAEERRQDTVAFGNDFASCVRDLMDICDVGKAQLQSLHRAQIELCALSTKKTTLDADISRLERQMIDLSSSLSTKASAVLEAQQLKESVVTKLRSFSLECRSRHEQIQVWREKASAFHSSAKERHQSSIVSASMVSFHGVYQMILESLKARGSLDYAYGIFPPGLEASCAGVDMAVQRFTSSIQDVAVSLLPSLIAYSRARSNLDEWLHDETGGFDQDVYKTWWLQTSELLEDLKNGVDSITNDVEFPDPSDVSSVSPPSGDITNIVSQLESVKENFGFVVSGYGISMLDQLQAQPEDDVGQMLNEMTRIIGSMRVSNAQSQKALKLVGATSIIDAMAAYDVISVKNGQVHLSWTALSELPVFRRLLHDAKTSMMLLDIVSTPKGALRRLRASDLLNSSVSDRRSDDLKSTTSGLNAAFAGVLQLLEECERFSLCLQEELVSMKLSDDLTTRQLGIIASVEEAASDGLSSLNFLLTQGQSEWTTLAAIISQAASVVDHWTDWRNALRICSICTSEDPTEAQSVAAMWLKFVARVLNSAANQPSIPVPDIAGFIEEFLNAFVKRSFGALLSSVITQEWKIQFAPPQLEDVSLRNQWAAYMSKHARECLPLSLTDEGSTDTNTPQPVLDQLAALVSNLTKCACAYWTRNWVVCERERRAARWEKIQRHHMGRLHYARWLSNEPHAVRDGDDLHSPTRLELLSALSAHVPRLNSISAELHPLEVSVLELAQQVEYIISQLSNMSVLNDNVGMEHGGSLQQMDAAVALHGQIQNCYSNASTLFGFARELCDLVQGVSVLETSLRDSASPTGGAMELSVDTIGKNLVESLRVASSSWHEAQSRLSSDKDETVKVAQELSSKRTEREQIAENEIAYQEVLLRDCSAKKESILNLATATYENVERLVRLLSAFEKPRGSSKHQASSVRDAPHLSATAASASLSSTSSQSTDIGLGAGNEARYATPSATNGRGSSAPAYSILENERLAKILLRSIRSIVPMDDIEDALEKHGQCFASLRGVIGRLELAARDFLKKIAPMMPTEQRNRSSFLEITTGTTVPSPAAAPIEWDAELVSIANALLEFADKISEPTSSGKDKSDVVAVSENAVSLLDAGRQLLSQSLKLFFEVSDMADRLSSAQQTSQSETQPVTVGSDANDEPSEERAPSASGGSTSTDSVLDGQAEVRVTQARSLRGMQVLSQIDDKLSGVCTEVEPRGARVLTVEQQASWLIEEATKVDNLCVMYEGWTPWI